jgi:omega-6 fatty acid desaturase (delta-12 desaturase)
MAETGRAFRHVVQEVGMAVSIDERTPAALPPSPGEVKRHLPPFRSSFVKGAVLAIVDLGGFIGATTIALYSTTWWVGVAAGSAAGLFVSLLFIVAHDACHGSLTPHRRVNALIGRVCFLPSLYPYSSWELGHNRTHHGWTNLRSRDYAWRPFDPQEYRTLPRRRRVIERAYRTVPGVALYNAVELWWTHMFWPRREERAQLDAWTSGLDRLLVAGYGLGLVALSIGQGASPIRAVICAVLLPLVLFHWLSGFVIFQHHTHARVPWYATREEWSFFRAQVAGTVHIRFPRWIGLLFHNIMEHGAHHANPRIPMYALEQAQARLEQTYDDAVVQVRWSLRDFREQLRICRLYDYAEHRWCDFDGRPQTPPLLAPAAGSQEWVSGAGRPSPCRHSSW